MRLKTRQEYNMVRYIEALMIGFLAAFLAVIPEQIVELHSETPEMTTFRIVLLIVMLAGFLYVCFTGLIKKD